MADHPVTLLAEEEASQANINVLKGLFQRYGEASGQIINPSKSTFYVGSISAARANRIADMLGFSIGTLPFTYLGVPIFKGKPKVCHLQPIADRIKAKLAAWKASLLSMAGRVQIVKSIIHGMLIYSFMIYAWPISLLKDVDRWIRNFIWIGNIDQRKLVTVAWDKVCAPTNEGGLGLRSLRHINEAANLKLCWDLFTSSSHWASLIRARVMRRNQHRFEGKSIHWRSAVNTVISRVSLSGNLSKKASFISMQEFVILKAFNVSVHHPKAPVIKEILWHPSLYNWIKCNTDGAALGSPGLASYQINPETNPSSNQIITEQIQTQNETPEIIQSEPNIPSEPEHAQPQPEPYTSPEHVHTHPEPQTSPKQQTEPDQQTQPEHQIELEQQTSTHTEVIATDSNESVHTEVLQFDETLNSPTRDQVDEMIKELTTSDTQLISFSQPNQNQQQQIPTQHCHVAKKTQEVGTSTASDCVDIQTDPQPQTSPQHTITPLTTEPHPTNSNNPDILSECNSMFSQMHGLHDLRQCDMPSSEYAAQWVSLTEKLVKELYSLQEAYVEEQKKFDKGKVANVEDVIQTQKDTESDQPESTAVRENVEQNLRDRLASIEEDLNEPIQDNLGANPINQEPLRNPVYEADIERI
ncbi:hypothetical protein TSUD_222460 [Trifolium subterraneum]|uniref:Reverse transcriptase zinc-binding domain-containing protein n=1 Tax=Trifolium subterraneum TaxID=3900 RepID=A0A2Z6M3U3_TRISU|nr:hypothetical protein TSUD_222460 [Trifolium subterraneum]